MNNDVMPDLDPKPIPSNDTYLDMVAVTETAEQLQRVTIPLESAAGRVLKLNGLTGGLAPLSRIKEMLFLKGSKGNLLILQSILDLMGTDFENADNNLYASMVFCIDLLVNDELDGKKLPHPFVEDEDFDYLVQNGSFQKIGALIRSSLGEDKLTELVSHTERIFGKFPRYQMIKEALTQA